MESEKVNNNNLKIYMILYIYRSHLQLLCLDGRKMCFTEKYRKGYEDNGSELVLLSFQAPRHPQISNATMRKGENNCHLSSVYNLCSVILWLFTCLLATSHACKSFFERSFTKVGKSVHLSYHITLRTQSTILSSL